MIPRMGRSSPPNGLEMSRPASQGKYRAKAKRLAGRVGSIELLGGLELEPITRIWRPTWWT
jgi:hypothetical protein